jgi:hypothetical protein
VDVDRVSRFPKAWWYGYNQNLMDAADRFLQFLFAPRWTERLKSGSGALRALFRSHRI